MTRGFIFWLIVVLLVLSYFGLLWSGPDYRPYFVYGHGGIELMLFALLGWQVYGPAIRG
jgi:hypothetical protein